MQRGQIRCCVYLLWFELITLVFILVMNQARPRQYDEAEEMMENRTPDVNASLSLAIDALRGIKVGDLYESGFRTPQENLCQDSGRYLKVLIFVTTATSNEKLRNAVRQTWGHFAGRRDVVMAFMVGRARQHLEERIGRENEVYGDIIQANFVDHYDSLTLKTLAMFEWVLTYCSEIRYILKTDDDVFINMPLLLSFLEDKAVDRRTMYGRLVTDWKPVRLPWSKYYVSINNYYKSKYPGFLTGPAYIVTSDVVLDVYQKALDTPYMKLEDVFFTGIIAESLGIRRVGELSLRNICVDLTDICVLINTISIHNVNYEEQFDIYKKVLDGRANC